MPLEGSKYEELVLLAEEYNGALVDARTANARKDKAGDAIKNVLRGIGETALRAGRFEIKIITSERSSLNTDVVKQLLTPEQYEQASEKKVIVTLRVDPARQLV